MSTRVHEPTPPQLDELLAHVDQRLAELRAVVVRERRDQPAPTPGDGARRLRRAVVAGRLTGLAGGAIAFIAVTNLL